jgi:DnaJ-class molecular chaperone
MGFRRGKKSEVFQDCGSCEGRGFNMVERQNTDGKTIVQSERCDTCKGTGQVRGGSR